MGFKDLDIAIQEISIDNQEYNFNKQVVSNFLKKGKGILGLKLKGFLKEYFYESKTRNQTI